MSTATMTLRRQLQAVGQILEQRTTLRDVVIMQAGDGFIIQGFELSHGYEQSRFVPVTLQIEAEAIEAALKPDTDHREVASPAPEKHWWQR